MRGLLQRIRLRLIELRPYPSYAARRRLRLGALGLLLIAAGGAGGWLLSDQLGDDDSGGPAPAPTVVIREDVEPEAAEELGFPAFATVNTTRVGGSDSIAVAAGVALAAIPATGGVEGPAAVALVEADDWATGIAAASLFANPIGIPLLLGSRGQVPQFTQEAIAELAPEGSRATKQAQI